MPSIELTTHDEVVETRTALELKQETVDIDVSTENSKSIEVTPNHYVISSTGIYNSGTLDGTAPIWLQEAIDERLANGTGDLSSLISELDAYVRSMSLGVNQQISNLTTADSQINALITTNKSASDISIAALSNTLTTKITADDATSLTTNILGTEFNGPGGNIASSWFTENISTYSSAIDSHTNSINSMYSAITDPLTGLTASADATSVLYSRVGINEDTGLLAEAGHLVDLSASVDDLEVNLTSTDTVVVDGETWTVGSAKLAKGPNGNVVGWSFSDGSGLNSNFTIQADKFAVSNASGSHSPFTIDTTTGKSQFNGIVSFTNVTDTEALATNTEVDTSIANAIDPLASMDWVANYSSEFLVNEDFGPAGTTTIDGGRITAGTSISSPVINGGTINGNTINGGLIEGGTISGVSISGSVIKSSWIDYSSTGTLTNWKYYGVVGNAQGYPEIPSAYEANFAHDSSTGKLVTDDEGYVRLPTVSPLSIEAVTASGTSTATVTCPLYSYSSYTVGSAIRSITTNPLVFVLAPVTLCSVGVTKSTCNTSPAPSDSEETGVFLYIEYNDGFNTYTHTVYSVIITEETNYNSGDGIVLIGGVELSINTSGYFSQTNDCGWEGKGWVGHASISVSMVQGTSYSLNMPDSSSRSSFKFTTETDPYFTSDSAPIVGTISYPAISVQQ